MLRVVEEIKLADFKAWSGGAATLEDLTLAQIEELEEYLVNLYPEPEIISDTELNDFLWFNRDEIAAVLGFEDYDELLKNNR